MDQLKIGKFIANRRKALGMTQLQLTEQLSVTDRAVSRWETGKTLPDSSIMLPLCQILQITATDLLCGEVVTMENHNKKIEENLLETARQKAEADKRLLNMEVVIIIFSLLLLFGCIAVASLLLMANWVRILLLAIGFVLFLVGMFFAIKIEQTAGYYKCDLCGHHYVPGYWQAFFAMHIGRTRYMKCPNCGKRSWQEKVLEKDD